MLYLVAVCLLPTLALAGQRSEPRSLYLRPDGERFLCTLRIATDSRGGRTKGRVMPARGRRKRRYPRSKTIEPGRGK
jgi:hypothetical protein